MKKLLFATLSFVLGTSLFAQAPAGINYQAIARSSSGAPISSTINLSVNFKIRTGSITGAIQYEEVHSPVNTNPYGLFTVVIGNGSPISGTLAGVAWGSGAKFLEVTIDDGGGPVNLGTTQLQSVPYALYSASGPIGPTGATGTIGATGATGSLGVTGATGATGNDGSGITSIVYNASGDLTITYGSGSTVTTGNLMGATGPTGATGTNGTNGIDGATGATGAVGTTGTAGTNGTDGATGATGIAGPTGAVGSAGTNGSNGTNGTDGATGATGALGSTGTTGSTGPTGDRYATATAASLVIATGSITFTVGTGLAYTVGQTVIIAFDPSNQMVGAITAYNPGTGSMTVNVTSTLGGGAHTGWSVNLNGAPGPAGPTGATGTAGSAGPAGATGATGSAGTNGTNGTNGAAGATGATGTAGTNGTNGTNGATGATGTAGTNGTNGAAGSTGATGPSWTLSSISYTANGSVTLTGTAGSGGPISSANAAWLTTGTSGTASASNFVGTTDNVGLSFRTNNIQRSIITNGGQFGFGTGSPVASAFMELVSTSGGILIPRMTTAQRTSIATPATGLLVYDGSLNQFYYYNGTAWTAISTGAGTVTSVGTGVGLTGGPITSAGTISLSNTTVTPGSYGGASTIPTFTVDAQGRLTSAGTVAVTGTLPGGANGQTLYHTAGAWTATSNLFNTGTNIGIGTTTPGSLLHIMGTADPIQMSIENGGGNFKTGLRIKTALNEWFLGQEASSASGFRITDVDAGVVRFQIDQSNGYVGIGTTTPGEELQVSNVSGDVGLSLISSNGGSSHLYFGNPTNTYFGAVKYNSSNHSMNFWTNNTADRMVIDNSGNVQIATLAIAGGGTVLASPIGFMYTVPGTPAMGSGTPNYTARWTGTTTLGIGALTDNGTTIGIGLGAISPSYTLAFAPINPTIGVNAPTSTANGSDLNIKAGNAFGANRSAGRLILQSGSSTGDSGGSGTSQIMFQVTPPGPPGSSVNSALTAISINDLGKTMVSTNVSGMSNVRLGAQTTTEGVALLGQSSTTVGNTYGVYGEANGVGAANSHGVYAVANGANTNYAVHAVANASTGVEAYGVYADASGGVNNWSGYFNNGHVYVNNKIKVGGGSISAPVYPVDIHTALGASAYSMNYTDGTVVASTYISGSTSAAIGTQSNHPFFIYTNNGGPRLTVLNGSGNVGIGMTTPGSRLQVENNVTTGQFVGLFRNTNTTTSDGVALRGESVLTAANYGIGVEGVGNYVGVRGVGTAGGFTALWGASSGATNAGYFVGNVQVTGTLSKGGGAFKIDDPRDPENKYLMHSFVESPDMMNVYNGNIVTDGSGTATVELPSYFEVINKDFRYQLTVIGDFAQAIVFEEVSGNKFKIKTDKPNIKVSWQVTGIRKDPWAEKYRIPNEIEKPANEKGTYQNPELYGQPDSKGLGNRESK